MNKNIYKKGEIKIIEQMYGKNFNVDYNKNPRIRTC